jgi:hypothetical protein
MARYPSNTMPAKHPLDKQLKNHEESKHKKNQNIRRKTATETNGTVRPHRHRKKDAST